MAIARNKIYRRYVIYDHNKTVGNGYATYWSEEFSRWDELRYVSVFSYETANKMIEDNREHFIDAELVAFPAHFKAR